MSRGRGSTVTPARRSTARLANRPGRVVASNGASPRPLSLPVPPPLPQYTSFMSSQIEYQAAAESAARATYEQARGSRPQNTVRSYSPRQEEFLEWCRRRCPNDHTNQLIDDRKLHLFLVEEVVFREKRKPGRKRKEPENSVLSPASSPAPAMRTITTTMPSSSSAAVLSPATAVMPSSSSAAVLSPVTTILPSSSSSSSAALPVRDAPGYTVEQPVAPDAPAPKVKLATVKQYITSIVDLHFEQAETDPCFNRPHPRGPLVHALVDHLKRVENELSRQNYEDRGMRTTADGYSTSAEMERIVDHFLATNKQQGLRNCTAFLLQHYGLLRGESVRMMELADLQTLLLEREGVTECHALVMVLKQGKTNQEGRVEFAAAMRNANVVICPLMMLSFYLFHRWHVAGEAFPCFQSNRDWFDIKLIRGRDRNTQSITYDRHRECILEAFKSVGIHSKAVTHAMRGSSARMAEISGTSEESIRRLGRWNNSALSTSYLTNLPRDILRTMAGFTREAGQFYLPRAAVTPPLELCKKVFPEVDRWRALLDAKQVEDSCAADSFLRLLVQLRVVFLQDSVLMKKRCPGHHLWQDPLFRDPLYLEFEHNLNHALENNEEPTDLLLQRAVPIIENRLAILQQQIQQQIAAQQQDTNRIVQSFSNAIPTLEALAQLAPNMSRIGDIVQHWDRIASGQASLSVTLNLAGQQQQQQQDQQQQQQQEGWGSVSLPSSSSSLPSTMTATVVLPSAAPAPSSSSSSSSAAPAPTSSSSSSAASAPTHHHHHHPQQQQPIYPSMNRTNVQTIPQLWTEWFDGWNGGMSVIRMEEVYKTAWRKSDSDGKWFRRRRAIIRKVQDYIERKGMQERVPEALDTIHRHYLAVGITSLDSLSKDLCFFDTL